MAATDFKPKRRTDRDTIAYAEFSGLRNDIAPERFDATDLAVANNVNLDKSRRLARRTGATKRLAMAVHSLWAGAGEALCASGTTLQRLSDALVPTQLSSALSGQPVSFARAAGQTYFNDNAHPGVTTPSGTRSWGLEAPWALATIVAGNLPAGVYAITATYVRDDGQESGAHESVFVTIAAGQTLAITVPASIDPTVVMKRLYVTTPNGDVLMHAATQVNAAPSYIVTAADIASMNEPLVTQFMGPAPAGQLVAYYKGRMFVAANDVLYPSEPFAYELFDLRNYIQLDGPITMLAPIEDKSGESSGFFIGTAESCGILFGSGPDDFKYVKKTGYGAVQGALAYVDGALYLDGAVGARPLPMWLTTEGVCVGMPDLGVNNLTRSRYSFDASGVGAAMFDPHANTFVAVSSEALSAIALQVENQTLTTYTGFAYNSFARVAGKNLAASGAGLFELVGDTDNGVPIDATVTLGVTDFGSSYVKALDRLYVGYRSLVDMALDVRTDDAVTNAYVLPISDQTGLATQRVKVGKGLAGRYWQFTLRNIGGNDFTFDTIDVKSAQLARRINGRA